MKARHKLTKSRDKKMMMKNFWRIKKSLTKILVWLNEKLIYL